MSRPTTNRPSSVPGFLLALVLGPWLVGCGAPAGVGPPVAVGSAGQDLAVRLIYPVVTTQEGVFISLGPGTWVEGAPARQIEYPGDGFYTLVAAATGPLPPVPSRFTVLTSSGPCDVAAGEPVLLERRGYDPEEDDYYGRMTDLAVEVASEACDEATFAYPAGAGTRLHVFEFAPADFGEPRHGTADEAALACLVTHPPSEGGCAGFPPTIVITAGDDEIFHHEVEQWVASVALLDSGGQRYVVVDSFDGFSVLTLSGEVVERAWHIGAIDRAETCD